MRRPETQAAVEPAARLSALVEKSRAVPDALVAVLLDLRPLCEGEIKGLPHEARKRLDDACSALKIAVADAAAVASYVNRLVSRNEAPIDSQTFPAAPRGESRQPGGLTDAID
jgi:hypothetical protein